MSKNRNTQSDREHTAALLRQIAAGNEAPTGIPTWLGHGGTQNAIVDLALLRGSDLESLDGVTKKRAQEHVYHLEECHGLEIECQDGIYRFTMQGL